MTDLEAVVLFAPVPDLVDSELRPVVQRRDRGDWGFGWALDAADADHGPEFRSWRERFELAHALGPAFQLEALLEYSLSLPGLVHLHDAHAELVAGERRSGDVLLDIPSEVASEAVEMIAQLASSLEKEQDVRGCRVRGDGAADWSGVALVRDVVLGGELELRRDGTLWLGELELAAWTIGVDGATVRDCAGQEHFVTDGASVKALALVHPQAQVIEQRSAAAAASRCTGGLGLGIGNAQRFRRSLLVLRA